jgi:hypothetical protein
MRIGTVNQLNTPVTTRDALSAVVAAAITGKAPQLAATSMRERRRVNCSTTDPASRGIDLRPPKAQIRGIRLA